MSENIQRRDFMKKSLAAGTGITMASASVLGANDRIRIGVIGCGRQGRGDMGSFMRHAEVQVVAVCDVYEPQLAEVKKRAADAEAIKDYRKLLDRKDIDAVIVGSPDHWHALHTIDACKAGKDVYVEKPISTTIAEGRAMVEAARKYKRVVQVGTQQRSGDHYQQAAKLVQSGALGKVTFVRTWNFGNQTPEGIGNPPDSNPPTGLDWDMWLGPAPLRPFNENRWGVYAAGYSKFRWFWDYAGGMMTDWGVHHLDIVQMVMNVDAPQHITALGGKYSLKDNRETPDTLMVTFEYPGFICTYENRECNGQMLNGSDYGMTFHGTEGTMFINRQYFEIIPEMRRVNNQPQPRMEAKKVQNANQQGIAHARNFLDCMKSRQQPICDIEIGHRSTSAALLGNVALRSGHRITWNKQTEKVENDPAANKFVSREYRKPYKLSV